MAEADAAFDDPFDLFHEFFLAEAEQMRASVLTQ